MLQLMREGCSYTYPLLSKDRYSFIQLNELEQYSVKQTCPTPQYRVRTRVLVVESPKLSHCALQAVEVSVSLLRTTPTNPW